MDYYILALVGMECRKPRLEPEKAKGTHQALPSDTDYCYTECLILNITINITMQSVTMLTDVFVFNFYFRCILRIFGIINNLKKTFTIVAMPNVVTGNVSF